MKKFFAGCIAVSFAAMLAACGDDASSTSPETTGNESSSSVEDVFSSSVIPSSSSEMPPDTACCKVMESSSSVVLVSSSSAVVPESSSSAVPVSSSAVAPKSSSSTVPASSSSAKIIISNMLWDGYNDRGEGQVETGGDSRTSGFWYEFNDGDNGGTSALQFPSNVDTHIYGSPFPELIEKYRGLQLGVAFGSGFDNPYAGVAFNVWSEEQEGVNVSPWGGICLQYKSSIDFEIELGLEDGAIPTMGSCSFVARVPASTSEKISDFGWEKFVNNCGAGVSPDIMDVLKKVATVKLKFTGDAGTTGEFLIERIGAVGMCHDMIPAGP